MSSRIHPFLFTWALIICCSITSVLGQGPYDYGFDVNGALAKRQLQDIIVTMGMPITDGVVPVRVNIRDLQQNADKWNLYILSLSLMQYTDESLPMSWYQISGIHGVPFAPWNGVQPTNGSETTGYCHHHTNLFPSWHRAYLALYEQVLCDLQQYIATQYTDGDNKTRYMAAAADCRVPYFDWAADPPAGETVLPPSVGNSPLVTISGPNGVQVISNPLYNYSFKPPSPDLFLNAPPWATWPDTVRAPTNTTPTALSNNSAINTILQQNLASNQQRLYNLFSNTANYTMFSNDGWSPQALQYDSLESIHDNIHAMLGGGQGHMAIVPFSSFDPVFWLHHTNVDRIFAMWQIVHPDSWIEPEAASASTYTISVGQILDSQTPLTPFYADSNGTFWNSDMLRDTAALGYTYPELSGFSLSNMTSNLLAQSARSQVITAITQLYSGPSPGRLALSSKRSMPDGRQSQEAGFSYVGSRQQPEALPLASNIISDDDKYREWTANIHVMKQALDGPFFITLSLTTPIPTQIGTMSIFASPSMFASMMNMAPGAGQTSGTVPLTAALMDKIADNTIDSLGLNDVWNFLQEFIHVEVIKGNGERVDPKTVSGLGIKIVSNVVQAPTNERKLPVWAAPDFELDLIL